MNNNDTNGNAVLDYREANVAVESNDVRELAFRFPAGSTGGKLRLTIEPASAASLVRVFDSTGVRRLGAPPFNADGEPIGAAITTLDVPFDPGVGSDWYA